jgi:hypothetical protein
MRYSEAGKGSRRRPQQVSDEELERNWQTAFDPVPGMIREAMEVLLAWSDGCGEVYTEEDSNAVPKP